MILKMGSFVHFLVHPDVSGFRFAQHADFLTQMSLRMQETQTYFLCKSRFWNAFRHDFLFVPLSIFSFSKLPAGCRRYIIAPSVYRGEPALFVRNGEMARGSKTISSYEKRR